MRREWKRRKEGQEQEGERLTHFSIVVQRKAPWIFFFMSISLLILIFFHKPGVSWVWGGILTGPMLQKKKGSSPTKAEPQTPKNSDSGNYGWIY
jgi:hypothetical protein